MGEADEIKNLLIKSKASFKSIQIKFKRRFQAPDKYEEAFDRWMSRFQAGSVTRLKQVARAETKEKSEEFDGVFERTNLIFQRPDQWLLEIFYRGMRTFTKIMNRDRWWIVWHSTLSRPDHIHTNVLPNGGSSERSERRISKMRMKTEYLLEEIDFLSPTFLLESHEIFAQGEGTFLDRGCVRLRSVPIPSKENRYGGFDWKIGDEYKLIVDRETGVLLYYSSIFEGEEMEICSAEEVIFDEVIPEIKFELNPTANQKVYLISD